MVRNTYTYLPTAPKFTFLPRRVFCLTFYHAKNRKRYLFVHHGVQLKRHFVEAVVGRTYVVFRAKIQSAPFYTSHYLAYSPYLLYLPLCSLCVCFVGRFGSYKSSVYQVLVYALCYIHRPHIVQVVLPSIRSTSSSSSTHIREHTKYLHLNPPYVTPSPSSVHPLPNFFPT